MHAPASRRRGVGAAGRRDGGATRRRSGGGCNFVAGQWLRPIGTIIAGRGGGDISGLAVSAHRKLDTVARCRRFVAAPQPLCASCRLQLKFKGIGSRAILSDTVHSTLRCSAHAAFRTADTVQRMHIDRPALMR